MEIESVVCFRWRARHGYRSTFTVDTVNMLRRMVARHYPRPHRFICVTDEPKSAGFDAEVERVKLWEDFSELQSPHGRTHPSCYRRLRVFAADAADLFGQRFVCMDLDTVIVGDLRPVFDRTEDFVIWGDTDRRSWYNGSLFMMTAGARRQVLDDFNPRKSPRQAVKAGRFGSDQGWISYKLGKGEAMWGREHGIYSYRVHIAAKGNRLPANASVVNFHGRVDPWSYQAQQIDWVREHYAS